MFCRLWWLLPFRHSTAYQMDDRTLHSFICGPGVFLAAAVWGGQWGGHIFIWGPRISDDIMHDWVNGVIWHQLCDAMLWIQLLCNPATLQSVSLGGTGGPEFSQGAVAPGHPLEPPLSVECRLARTSQYQSISLGCSRRNIVSTWRHATSPGWGREGVRIVVSGTVRRNDVCAETVMVWQVGTGWMSTRWRCDVMSGAHSADYVPRVFGTCMFTL